MALPYLVKHIYNNGTEEVIRRGKKIHALGNVELLEYDDLMGNVNFRVKDDGYAIVDTKNGEILKEESIINILIENDYEYLVLGRPMGNNIIHLNESQPILVNDNYVNQGEKKGKGLLGNNLEVSGVTRFITIQRTMQQSYVDMTTSDKNISFTDYPSADANSGANAGFPLLELNLQSQIKQDFNFNVGYSLGHNITGDVDASSRNIGAVQNLNFGAQLKTGLVKTSIWFD